MENIKEGFCACKVKCNICTHVWIATYHNTVDKLQCPHCDNMTEFEIIEDLIKNKQDEKEN